jgi:hypothetical protein
MAVILSSNETEVMRVQTQERFAILQQMELYFKNNPKPEIPVEPQTPSTNPNDYKDVKITFPEDCVTSEHRKSYMDAYINNMITERQKQYEADCKEYPSSVEKYEQYVKDFEKAFPSTEEEKKIFDNDNKERMESIHEFVNTDLYENLKEEISPSSMSIAEAEEGFYLENVIEMIAERMRKGYIYYDDEQSSARSVQMAQFMFPKIEPDVGEIFSKNLFPDGMHKFQTVGNAAYQMMENILEQNADNIQFLIKEYVRFRENEYLGNPVGGKIRWCFEKLVEKYDEQDRRTQEIVLAGDRAFLLKRTYEPDCEKIEQFNLQKIAEDGKEVKPYRTTEKYQGGKILSYDENKNLRRKIENNMEIQYDKEGKVTFHYTNGVEDTSVYLATERIAKRKKEKLAKLEGKPKVVQKVVAKVADTKAFNDIALKVATRKIKKARAK